VHAWPIEAGWFAGDGAGWCGCFSDASAEHWLRKVYWGSESDARSPPAEITHLFNLAGPSDIPSSSACTILEEERKAGIEYFELPLVEEFSATSSAYKKMEHWIRHAVAWIDKSLQLSTSERPSNVLVCCLSGENRSAAVLLAWLLQHGIASSRRNITGFKACLRELRRMPGKTEKLLSNPVLAELTERLALENTTAADGEAELSAAKEAFKTAAISDGRGGFKKATELAGTQLEQGDDSDSEAPVALEPLFVDSSDEEDVEKFVKYRQPKP
jgi:protein-tyrosine phosphatase